MGNCVRSCLPKSDATSSTAGSTAATTICNILPNQNSQVEFTFLIEDNHGTYPKRNKRSFLSRIFNKRNDNRKKPVLDLVDGLLNPQLTAYSRLNESQRLPSTGSCTSRDIQLQYLDARALLSRTATSTPASSLDLEWEHETYTDFVNITRPISKTALPEDFSQCVSESSPQHTVPHAIISDSEWSRVSSTNSLEWDNVENPIQAINSPQFSEEIDTDTQMLLCEIERLTNKTLEETGQDLFS